MKDFCNYYKVDNSIAVAKIYPAINRTNDLAIFETFPNICPSKSKYNFKSRQAVQDGFKKFDRKRCYELKFNTSVIKNEGKI